MLGRIDGPPNYRDRIAGIIAPRDDHRVRIARRNHGDGEGALELRDRAHGGSEERRRRFAVLGDEMGAGFVEPASRSYLLIRYGRIGNRLILLNMSDKKGSRPFLSSASSDKKGRDPFMTEPEQGAGFTSRELNELGPLSKKLSEVDVSAPDNLRVSLELHGRAIDLSLGNRNFKSRLQDFLDHYAEIRKRSGGATSFDLRLDDRITTRE